MTTDGGGLSRAAWRDPRVLICTLVGIGFIPRAPGTWGSVLALALWWPMTGVLGLGAQLACVALAVAVGVAAIAGVAHTYRVHDHRAIVIDELAGMWLTLLTAPRIWWVYALGFALFRLFDIWKPWPVSWADRSVPGAWGVMLDDVLAGLMAAAVLQFTVFVVV